MANNKNIKLLNKTFDQWMNQFAEHAKVYFPQTYNDFNESDPGTLFFEASAYVGDVMSFYLDKLYRENLLLQAKERKNVLDISQAYGYKPKLSTPSTATLDVFQIVPASGSGTSITYDTRYCLSINPNTLVKSTASDNTFIVEDAIDFNVNTLSSPVSSSVYRIDATSGNPEYYLLKKSVSAISADIETITVTVAELKKFLKIQINNPECIKVLDITDSDGLIWSEVEYLAQDTIFDKIENTEAYDQSLSAYQSSVPYLLRLKRVPRRFITRINSSNLLEIRFGSGISIEEDDIIVPNPENVGLHSLNGLSKFDQSYDPSNFMYNRTYGQVPVNTTLTIRYLAGGGVSANSPANTINNIVQADINSSRLPQTNTVLNTQIINSLAATNPLPARGGSGQEDIESIRQNGIATLYSQNRAVTIDDYIVRAYSMDPQFGHIAKAFAIQSDVQNLAQLRGKLNNPLTINLYCLGFDANNKLTTLNDAVNQNLKTYMNEYRVATDNIVIKSAYIVNIRVVFEIVVKPEFNDNDVLLQSINRLKEYFNINHWQINQPIIIGDVYSALKEIDGVQHVTSIKFENIYDGRRTTPYGQSVNVDALYSNVIYDLNTATRRGMIFPSVDPSIFEVKYPDQDIIGRVSTY